MRAETNGHQDAAGHEPHVVPVAVYLAVYVGLMVLLVATVAVYYIHFPWNAVNNLAALTIAITKAVLVILFFMGVRYSSRLTWVWAAAGFMWLIILFTTLGDYITRDWVRVTGFPR